MHYGKSVQCLYWARPSLDASDMPASHHTASNGLILDLNRQAITASLYNNAFTVGQNFKGGGRITSKIDRGST